MDAAIITPDANPLEENLLHQCTGLPFHKEYHGGADRGHHWWKVNLCLRPPKINACCIINTSLFYG